MSSRHAAAYASAAIMLCALPGREADYCRALNPELIHVYAAIERDGICNFPVSRVCAANGVPLEVVSKRLSHSSIRVTAEWYLHVYSDRDAAAAVENCVPTALEAWGEDRACRIDLSRQERGVRIS